MDLILSDRRHLRPGRWYKSKLLHSALTGNPFLTSSLIVSLLVWVRTRPPARVGGAVLLAGVALAALSWRPGLMHLQVMFVLACVGICAIFVNIATPYFLPRDSWQLWLVRDVLFAPLLALATVLLLALSASATPVTLDLHLYAIDGGFGFQPGFAFARFLVAHPWLRLASEIAYANLPVGLALVYFSREDRRFVYLCLGIGIIGYLTYFFMPAVGSMVAFGRDFPNFPPPLAPDGIHPTPMPLAPRNCMPSLHGGWALACLAGVATARLRWRLLTWLFVALTLLYAASFGHYVIDLVVTAPFALGIYGVVYRRPVAAIAGLSMFAIWLAAIRWAAPAFAASPALTWTTVVLTVACTAAFALALKPQAE